MGFSRCVAAISTARWDDKIHVEPLYNAFIRD